MKTPHALPKEHAFAPVKYDVEEDNGAKDVKLIKKNLAEYTSTVEGGDCDVGDEKCQKESVKIPTLAEAVKEDKEKAEEKSEKKDDAAPADKQEPSDESKIQTKSHIRIGDDQTSNKE